MVALFILLALVALSIFLTRITTKALVLTGLSEQVARFQARSVLTGTGFTTNESESIMRHPVRRRIALWLMLAQSAGLVTVISTFVLTFVDTGTMEERLWRGLMLVGGLGLLAYLARNKYVENVIEQFIDRLLDRFTDLKVKDYHTLLHLEKDYAVQRVSVKEDSWLSGKTLQELEMARHGVIVLCIEREDTFIGAPKGDDEICAGDRLTMYGTEEAVSRVSRRLIGENGEQVPLERNEKPG